MMCLFRQGGGGEAEATLSDAQLSRFSGPDVLCKLRHPGGLPTVVSTGIKGKTGWWMVGFIIVPSQTSCVFYNETDSKRLQLIFS